MQALDPIPIPLSGAAPFEVQLEGRSAGGIFPATVKLDNGTAYALKVRLGGDTNWLSPGISNVFSVPPGAATMTVSPVILTTPLPPTAYSTLLVTLAAPGETIPGTYPAAIPALQTPPPGVLFKSGSFTQIVDTPLIAGVVGQSIRVWFWQLDIVAATTGFGQIFPSPGPDVMGFIASPSNGDVTASLPGLPLPVGAGIHGTYNGPGSMQWTVAFQQY